MAQTVVPEAQSSGMRAVLLKLRRHTSSGLYIPELDGLRFAAILSVFLFHVSGDVDRHGVPGAALASPLFRLAQELNVGVPMFFAISGMILGLPFARYWLAAGPSVSLKRYFVRRLTRLEPPYVVAMLLLFVFKLVSGRGVFAEQLPHLGASLVYLHGLIYRDMSTINPVAWSLEVEVQFYILAPALATIFAIGKPWLRRTAIGAVIAVASHLAPWTDMNVSRHDAVTWLSHISLAGNIQYFMVGFLFADLYLMNPPARQRRRGWDWITLFGWPLFAIALLVAPAAVHLFLPAIVMALYAAVFYGARSNRLFANLWIATIGGMCYSIYLLHNYLIAALGFVTERLGQSLPFEARFAIQLLLLTPPVLVSSVLFYRFVEQPCMRSDWPARLMERLARARRNGFARP